MVKNKNLKEAFGILKGWKIDTQKFKDELRKEEARDFAKFKKLRKN